MKLRVLSSLRLLFALFIFAATMQNVTAAPAQCLQFGDDMSDSYLANPATKTIRTLPQSPRSNLTSEVSPDGRYIAYSSQDQAGRPEINVANADGSNRRSSSLDLHNAQSGGPRDIYWSADSLYLALYIDTDGGSFTQLFVAANLKPVALDHYQIPIWPFTWSPQGHRFAAWASMDNGLYSAIIASPESGIEHSIQGENGFFEWSPNGKYVAVVSQEIFNNSKPTISFIGDDITAFSVNGPVQRDAGEGAYIPLDIGWTADSRYFVYSYRPYEDPADSDQKPRQLVSVDMQTQHSIVLVPAMAPATTDTVRTQDTSRFAVPIQIDGNAAVALTNPDGNDQVVLHNVGKYIADMLWSPDGKFIMYVAATERDTYLGLSDPDFDRTTFPAVKLPPPQTLSRLVWARRDGTGEKALPFRHIHILKWDTDKNLLIFIAGNGDNNRILALNPATGVSTTLTDTLTYNFYRDTYYDAWGRWAFYSGPNKRLVAITSTVDFAGVLGGGGPEYGDTQLGAWLYLSAWDGSMHRLLAKSTEKIGPVVWSADGLRFAYLVSEVSDEQRLVVDSYDGKTLWRTGMNEIKYNDPQSLAWTSCS